MGKKKDFTKDYEQTVIGSAMRDKDNFLMLAKIVRKAEMFSTFAHQSIWRCMYTLHREGGTWEPAFLFDIIHREKVKEDVGGPSYFIELWENGRDVPIPTHAQKIVECYLRRRSKELLKSSLAELDDIASEPDDVADRLKVDLATLVAGSYPPDEDDEGEDDGSFKPFPLNALPTAIAEYAEAGGAALRCDPSFIAVPALVAFGSVVGNSAMIELKATWREPSIFWAAIVAEPSAMKSPSLDLAFLPMMSIQKSLAERYENQHKQYKAALEEWNDKRFRRSRHGTSGDDEPKPERPIGRKLVVCDITIEKLAHILHENPMGVCLCRDELAGWFASFGRYADGGGASADMSQWLQLFGGRSLIVDRRTGDPPSIFIPRASVCVAGGIQPKILQRCLTSDSFESGLAARLLFAMPRGTPGKWTEDIVPMDVYNAYANLISSTYYEGAEHLAEKDAEPMIARFDVEGKKAWVCFFDEWTDRQEKGDGETAAALAKLKAYCARFALLHAVADRHAFTQKELTVTETHVYKAFNLVEWFAAETDRVYTRLRRPADDEQRDKLVAFISAREGKVTARDLHKSNKKRYASTESAEKALNELVERNFGTWGIKGAGEKGGRPTKVFQLQQS